MLKPTKRVRRCATYTLTGFFYFIKMEELIKFVKKPNGETESVKIGDSVLYGASKSKLQPSGDILLFDIFALVGGKFIPVRVDQSDIGMYNYIWKLEDKHQPKTGNEKVEEPEAVRFAKWAIAKYTNTTSSDNDNFVWYERFLNSYSDHSSYTTEELYTKFKQETK